MIQRPTAIDLFSGAGGMSLGVEAAGFDVIGAIELDSVHCAIHELNFPYCETICADITSLDISKIAKSLKREIDLIVGGPPCQGFSQIGLRQLDDPRNSLVKAYCKAINDIQPKYFIFENVPGITRGKHKDFLKEMLRILSSSGYHVEPPRLLNAYDFGVPQKRERCIVIGSRKDVKKASYPVVSQNQKQHSLFENTTEYHSAMDALQDLENHMPFIKNDEGIPVSDLQTGTPYSIFIQDKLQHCHTRSPRPVVYNHVASKHTDISIQRFSETQPGKNEPVSRFYKLHPDNPCNTLRAGTASDRGAYTAPRPIHYIHPRCITVREAARLHSYPDWFVFHDTIWHGFREIGNSVAPIFAKALSDSIYSLLRGDSPPEKYSESLPNNDQLRTMNMTEASQYFGVKNPIPPRKRQNGK